MGRGGPADRPALRGSPQTGVTIGQVQFKQRGRPGTAGAARPGSEGRRHAARWTFGTGNRTCGWRGQTAHALTADRAKPAVTFGGTYRLVDFVLSNLVNADILRICVLTQYKSHSWTAM